jgi:hypothetical protein
MNTPAYYPRASAAGNEFFASLSGGGCRPSGGLNQLRDVPVEIVEKSAHLKKGPK